MGEKFDLTFYYKVKAKFKATAGTVIFISETSDNIDELMPQEFSWSEKDDREFQQLIKDHWGSKSYFVLSRYEDYYTFFYCCKEFLREEDYITGKIKSFKLVPYRYLEIDMDMVRAELIKLGQMLSGDSEAS